METKFTPGPWKVVADVAEWEGLEIHSPPDDVRNEGYPMVVALAVNSLLPEHRANAHLIAAAPEMYEALENLVGEIDDIRAMRAEYGGHVPQLEEEIAAIEVLKKAQGDVP